MTETEKEILREEFTSEEAFQKALNRLNNGEPLAYIIGKWFFWRESYKITPDVLIPRPETEHLVELACSLIPQNGRFLELCTGSGCIPISILNERIDLHADTVELSPQAVKTATENIVKYGLCERLHIYNADALSTDIYNLTVGKNNMVLYDAIVSNPPYIRSDIIRQLSVQVRQEPRMALDGGEDGLKFYKRFLDIYPRFLKQNGIMLFEIGYDQADDLVRLCDEKGFSCKVFKDYSGNNRVVKIFR